MSIQLTLLCASYLIRLVFSGNPIIPGVGMADPHIHVFPSSTDPLTAYMYATHDYAQNNTNFRMDNWWVWKSTDLVTWGLADILSPLQTSLRQKNFTECWATDAAYSEVTKTYYFYVSLGPDAIGVVRSVSGMPGGPWMDPLGKPLIASFNLTSGTRDPGVLRDTDGTHYLIFGTFKYFIAKLGSDLISLAEEPQYVHVHGKFGPYGKGQLDDKPFLHIHNGTYYLSWGCFYATSNTSVYGPYTYQGSVISPLFLFDGFNDTDAPYMDRHGSFFTLHQQNYFVANDRTHGAQPYFRNSVMGYVFYYRNGSIAPVVIDSVGVGQYPCCVLIEAEKYFYASGSSVSVQEKDDGHTFVVSGIRNHTVLKYPKVAAPSSSSSMLHLRLKYSNANDFSVLVNVTLQGKSTTWSSRTVMTLASTKSWGTFRNATSVISVQKQEGFDLSLEFVAPAQSPDNIDLVEFDSWQVTMT